MMPMRECYQLYEGAPLYGPTRPQQWEKWWYNAGAKWGRQYAWFYHPYKP